ncbi:MAG: CBS domain-containing protein [Candidatus Bathyarchaeota archaeon]|nr:CBS domain-containing protein [Candidatus Bathyarchaeota archaeon]
MILMGIAVKISQIMTKEIISVKSEASVSEAASIMVRSEVGAVVVTKNSTPVGIITEVDILKRCCIGKACSEELKTEEIMTKSLVTINADAAIGEAAILMSDKKIRRLLVTENGKIVGIVTEKDVLRATLAYFENVLLTI